MRRPEGWLGILAALSVPVELDGGVIGTLDIYARQPRDWDPSEIAPRRPIPGWWPASSRRR
jgi:GAF domain-containing protein